MRLIEEAIGELIEEERRRLMAAACIVQLALPALPDEPGTPRPALRAALDLIEAAIGGLDGEQLGRSARVAIERAIAAAGPAVAAD